MFFLFILILFVYPNLSQWSFLKFRGKLENKQNFVLQVDQLLFVESVTPATNFNTFETFPTAAPATRAPFRTAAPVTRAPIRTAAPATRAPARQAPTQVK